MTGERASRVEIIQCVLAATSVEERQVSDMPSMSIASILMAAGKIEVASNILTIGLKAKKTCSESLARETKKIAAG